MPSSLVIIDLEATCCDDDSFPRTEMEIIEIGAVSVAADTGEFESEFQAFVRPVRHPVLTDFCRNLTSITQAEVDTADAYPATILRLSEWLTGVGDYVFCSWGAYDRMQFEQDSAFHSVAYPFSNAHRNLKVEFADAIGSKRKFGLGGALRKIGLPFDGTPHRGIDDAKNIARLYAHSLAPNAR